MGELGSNGDEEVGNLGWRMWVVGKEKLCEGGWGGDYLKSIIYGGLDVIVISFVFVVLVLGGNFFVGYWVLFFIYFLFNLWLFVNWVLWIVVIYILFFWIFEDGVYWDFFEFELELIDSVYNVFLFLFEGGGDEILY